MLNKVRRDCEAREEDAHPSKLPSTIPTPSTIRLPRNPYVVYIRQTLEGYKNNLIVIDQEIAKFLDVNDAEKFRNNMEVNFTGSSFNAFIKYPPEYEYKHQD